MLATGSRVAFTLSCLVALACGAAGTAPQQQPPRVATESAVKPQSDTRSGQLTTAPLPAGARANDRPLEREVLAAPPARSARELPRELPGVARASSPPECRSRPVAVPARRGRVCDAAGGAIEGLARAVEISRPRERDSALEELESCAELPAGMVRTLRADLLRECADTLVAPYLRATKQVVDAELADAMLALALSARWARAFEKLRPFTGAGTQAELARFHSEVLLPWKARQLEKLAQLEQASAVVGPSGYGSTIAALALAREFRRLWTGARAAPIPDPVKRNYEARVRYYTALDAAIADVRARAEALAEKASERISTQGLHRAPDADAHFGQRDDGYLGLLLLEAPPSVVPSTVAERVAARVPSFYTELLFGDAAVANARLLRLLAESGLSPRQRYALSRRKLDVSETEIIAYFHATLAQRTRIARHWDEALALLEPLPHRSPQAELVLATARAARTGPRSYRASKSQQQRVFDVRALEQLSTGTLPPRIRAFALSNAARLLVHNPASLDAAYTLLQDARAAAPEPATRECIRPFDSGRFQVDRDTAPPCDLPALP